MSRPPGLRSGAFEGRCALPCQRLERFRRRCGLAAGLYALTIAGASALCAATSFLLAGSSFLLAGASLAQDASPATAAPAGLPEGAAVVARVNERDEGESSTRQVRMTLEDKRGHQRVRETVFVRRFFDEEKRMAIFYESPSNVKGTAFLTYDYGQVDREDDQWLYLPALRRARRISASDRGDYFLGTDLTYEDIKNETRISIGDYDWRTVEEVEVDGHRCLRVEGVPRTEQISRELGYGRVQVDVDAEIWIVRASEYWDRADRHLKTSQVGDIRQVDGIWTPHRIEVRNHRSGHQTTFEVSGVDYATPIDEGVFQVGSLRRGPP